MLWYQSIPKWFQKFFPLYIWQIPGKESNDVYLTFDDGPHPDISIWVCEQLERYQMKATFFCVGDNVRKYPGTLESILSKGHIAGNHTMHHLKGWNTGTEVYTDDVKQCSDYVKSDLFRPPYGRISKNQSRALQKNYRIVMWNLLSCDFDKKLNPEKALKGLKKKTTNGSIIVFHDSEKAEQNLKFILPPYLEFLNAKGYICKTL